MTRWTKHRNDPRVDEDDYKTLTVLWCWIKQINFFSNIWRLKKIYVLNHCENVDRCPNATYSLKKVDEKTLWKRGNIYNLNLVSIDRSIIQCRMMRCKMMRNDNSFDSRRHNIFYLINTRIFHAGFCFHNHNKNIVQKFY